MSDEKRTVGEPHDRLTRIANAMLDAGEEHPEHGDEQAIVFLASKNEDRSGIAIRGYDPEDGDVQAMTDLFIHMRAIFRANGSDLRLLRVPKR